MNVLDSIALQVRAHPEHTAVVVNGQSRNYRQLWRNINRTAYHLDAQGVRAGDCVAVSRLGVWPDLITVLALARLGAISSPVQRGWPDQKRAQVFLRNGVSAWVRDEADKHPLLGVPGLRAITAQSLFAPTPKDAKGPELATGLADRVWRISLSSGTSGDSKSIPWTHGQVSALHRFSLDIYPSGPGERLLVFADLGIGLGMGHAMMQLVGGGAVILADKAAAEHFFEAVERDRPTRALTTTGIAFSLLEHAEKTGRTAPTRLLSLLLGGSAVSPALRQGLEQKVCANLQVTYGSTETGTLARADAHSFLSHPGSAGRVVPWVQAQAVDDQDQVLPAGQTGRLRFKSPVIATHYLGNPEASAQVFRSGWYYPGDSGSIDSAGNLTLGGRTDQVLNLQGVKVNPQTVEDAINTHPLVVESGVAAVLRPDGRQVLVAMVVTRAEVDPRELRALVREKVGRLSVPARVLKVQSLPKNPAGKLMRKQLQALVESSLNRDRAAPASGAPGSNTLQ